ncbi:MAG: hypothetical protein WKF40_04135 [Thermoleophilaceae bacterium]
MADELRLLGDAAEPDHGPRRTRPGRRGPSPTGTTRSTRWPTRPGASDCCSIIDEFPELVAASPELPGVLRAFWDRAAWAHEAAACSCAARPFGRCTRCRKSGRRCTGASTSRCCSIRSDRTRPRTCCRRLKPADQALVWGIVGGIPLYLSWWDRGGVCGGEPPPTRLHTRGTAAGRGPARARLGGRDMGGLGELVLRAIAAGRTRHSEIEQAVRAEPGRVLDRLVELRLVERVVPVTERRERTRRRSYRIADNFLSFWLGQLDRHRSAIGRGLGSQVAPRARAPARRSHGRSLGGGLSRAPGPARAAVASWARRSWTSAAGGGLTASRDRRGGAGGSRPDAGAGG